MTDHPADSILVLLETTPNGELATSAAGLLGAASRIGTPVALAVVAPGRAQALAEQAAAAGAAKVLVVESDSTQVELTIPHVDALAAAAAVVAPDAVLISNSIDGRDIAGRFAARASAPIAVDAIGVSRDDEGIVAHHSVYGGVDVVRTAVDRVVGDDALVVARDADRVDGDRGARSGREAASDIAAVDRVRHEHGIGRDGRCGGGERVDVRDRQLGLRRFRLDDERELLGRAEATTARDDPERGARDERRGPPRRRLAHRHARGARRRRTR